MLLIMSAETERLIRDGEKGGGGKKEVWRRGKRQIIDLSLHCHHQNDSCIIKKMGSDGSHCNASFTVRDKITKQCPQTTACLKGKESRSGRDRAEAFLLTSLTPYR